MCLSVRLVCTERSFYLPIYVAFHTTHTRKPDSGTDKRWGPTAYPPPGGPQTCNISPGLFLHVRRFPPSRQAFREKAIPTYRISLPLPPYHPKGDSHWYLQPMLKKSRRFRGCELG